MILVDTNVLVAVIRTRDPKITALLGAHSGAVCGIVRAELLQGARTPAERINVMAMLGALTYVPIEETLWDEVGDNLAILRSRGAVVPLPDVVLATLAISLSCELWSRDAHFVQIQSVLPTLQLFAEPP